MNNLVGMMKKIDSDREVAEAKLKEVCNKSSRLNYDDLIEKLLEITEHSMHVNYYKFASFIGWLAGDLEYYKIVNEDSWDMNIEEIDRKFNDEGKGYLYKNPKEFKGIMLDWMYTHCLDSVFAGLKREYEYRKSKGMI